MSNKYEYWHELYLDAVSHRVDLDLQFERENKLYDGKANPKDPLTGAESSKKAYTFRNMIFELIETQINNAIPQPKVTPRDPENQGLASDIECYLQLEMDRLCSELVNDESERGVYKHGTGVYYIGWDETKSTPISRGELTMKYYSIDSVYPQPGVSNSKDLEYVFVVDLVSTKKIKKLYGVDVPEHADFKGLAKLVTAWYYDDEGYVCRFGFVEESQTVVFDDADYELRMFLTCSDCGYEYKDEEICPVCQSNKKKWSKKEFEIADDDYIKADMSNPENQSIVARKGDSIPYYKVKMLPFVFRKNISKEGSLYGISDISVLEENQMSMNKILTKMQENVLKAGSFVTTPVGVNIPNNDETLKIVKIKDPNMMKAFSVQTVQANMQQDMILQEQFYQMARDTLGITDSYQGKRDNTAESGKAKQISAAQAAGRMESKRRMKDAAYAELYEIMFKFLLAYCDEPRTFAKMTPTGEYISGKFNRKDFLDGSDSKIYYNDRFLFSVDTASILTTNREAMWRETTNNFVGGTFGNPADPQTLILYWNVMKGLNYPLAKQAISNLQQRSKQLPQELQEAIMQNPEILKAVQAVIANPEIVNAVGGNKDVSNSK